METYEFSTDSVFPPCVSALMAVAFLMLFVGLAILWVKFMLWSTTELRGHQDQEDI